MDLHLDIPTLSACYAQKATTPPEVIETIYGRIEANDKDSVWISHVPKATALARARFLESIRQSERKDFPLFGLPFNVKDNIDVAGMPTTAGCPDFAYTPSASSPVVEKLEAAGAILIGKTNLDQFATGLVGTRSPYGTPKNAINPNYIPGGSSSGAAVSVAAGLSSFAIGTDTGGSGRVPAAFNNLVGIKPTRGLLSVRGVIPANRSLDCLSVFALTVEDGAAVRRVAEGFDRHDPWSRIRPNLELSLTKHFRFAVPDSAFLDFLGDDENERLFKKVLETIQSIGGTQVPIDYSPFLEINALLFQGPFVAERAASLCSLPNFDYHNLLPVTQSVLNAAEDYDGQDAFNALHRLQVLRRQAEHLLEGIEFIAVPTTPTIWTIAEEKADPIGRNLSLSRYTNFVNFLDLAAIALPVGFRPNGLPAGITLAGQAFSDDRLAIRARDIQQRLGLPLGARQGSTPDL